MSSSSVLALSAALVLASDPAVPPPPAGRTVAFVTTAVLASTVSVVASTWAGASVHGIPIELEGRPRPWVTVAGFAVGLGLNALLVHLATPEATRWGDGPGGVGDPALARAEAWRWSRWALAGSGAGLVTLGIGAALEQGTFGQGQGTMLVGAILSFLGGVVFDVLEAVGAWNGHLASRRLP